VRTHRSIDERSLAMARAIAAKIDADPGHGGVQRARAICERWERLSPSPNHREWLEILRKPWAEIRAILLEDSEEGRRRRQNSPFCGILTSKERWSIYRRFQELEKAGP